MPKQETDNTRKYKVLLFMKVGDKHLFDATQQQLTAYAFRNDIKIKTENIVATYKDFTQKKFVEVTILEEYTKTLSTPIEPAWKLLYRELPNTKDAVAIKTLLKKYYGSE